MHSSLHELGSRRGEWSRGCHRHFPRLRCAHCCRQSEAVGQLRQHSQSAGFAHLQTEQILVPSQQGPPVVPLGFGSQSTLTYGNNPSVTQTKDLTQPLILEGGLHGICTCSWEAELLFMCWISVSWPAGMLFWRVLRDNKVGCHRRKGCTMTRQNWGVETGDLLPQALPLCALRADPHPPASAGEKGKKYPQCFNLC